MSQPDFLPNRASAGSTPSHRSVAAWADGPWIDLLIGCGGWSLPLLLVSYLLVDRDIPRWSAAFYALALVCNYPHYMATIHRAYGQRDRGQHRLYTHYLTAALVAIGIAAHVKFALVPWLFTAYLMWSPWHYTGQNFGLLMMFLRREGLTVAADKRRQLHVAFMASFVMLLAAFNTGPSGDPLVLSLGLPALPVRGIQIVCAVVFAGGLISALVSVAKRAGPRALIAPITLCSTQALWFVVPVAVGWMFGLATPQTRYSSGVLALMHSAQYLWITEYFARRDASATRGASAWNAGAYWAALFIGGLALFLPVPWLASYVLHVDFTASVFIVAAVVNIHHFLIDGVVWKLRSSRVGRVLLTVDTTSSGDSAAVGGTAGAAFPRPTMTVWRIVAAAALIALAALDQWRYVLAVGHTDVPRLAAAARLNPYDSGANLRLSQAAGGAGDTAAAESALRKAVALAPDNPIPTRALVRLLIESRRLGEAYGACQALLDRWPGDVDMLVNAGVLAYQFDKTDAALAWWTKALDVDPAQTRVHLYVAELLHTRRQSHNALPHYQAYLEQVSMGGANGRPSPTELVLVVLKFADALSQDGRTTDARKQYDLAEQIARQTGLTDLADGARRRSAGPTESAH